MGRTTQSARKAYPDDGRSRFQLAVTRVDMKDEDSFPGYVRLRRLSRFSKTRILTHAMARDYDKLMNFGFVREQLATAGSIHINADESVDHLCAAECIDKMAQTTSDAESGRKPCDARPFPEPDTPVALITTATSAGIGKKVAQLENAIIKLDDAMARVKDVLPVRSEAEPKPKRARTDDAGPATAAPAPPDFPTIYPAIPVTVLGSE